MASITILQEFYKGCFWVTLGLLCKIRQGLIIPALVQMSDDAEDYSIHASGIVEATHSPGSTPHLSKGSFNSVGSPYLCSVRERTIQEIQHFLQVLL